VKKIVLLITMGLSFCAVGQNFDQKCFEHYDGFSSLSLNHLIKDKKQFEMTNDDRFKAQCNDNKLTLIYNDYKSDMTRFMYMIEDNNKTSAVFNNFNFTNKTNKNFINQFFFSTKKTKLNDVTISYKKIYKKNPTISDAIPIMSFSPKVKSLTLECNNINSDAWILNDDIRKFNLRKISFINCNIKNSKMLYKINAYTIDIVNSKLDSVIHNNGFSYAKKITLKNNIKK
jgi:hypothetical protein